MKILYLSRTYTLHDRRFLQAMTDEGHQVFFARLEPNAANQDPRPLPSDADFADWDNSLAGLEALIADVQPDLLQAGPLPSGGYLAAQTDFHPLVLMSWGSDILHQAKEDTVINERVATALAAADAVIGDCAPVREAVCGYGVPDERVVTFPWGIDLDRFNPDVDDGGLRAELGWQDAFVLLHLRSWESLYGVETVVNAFVQAARLHPELRLLMPGAGSLEAELLQIFEAGGAGDRVHLPGQLAQDDLPRYHAAADLYVTGSHSDGASVSLLEALASGLPALVSDIPGNREWITEGEQGWLTPVGDVDALAAAISQAVEYGGLPAISRRARQLAEVRADWDQNKKGIFKTYEIAMERLHV